MAMNRKGRPQCGAVVAALVSAMVIYVANPALAEEAQLLVGGKWRKTPALTVGEVKGFTAPGPVRLSQYGGWAERKVKATGFFHTRKIDGRWWLVDPEGCLFISVGLCSVNTGSSALDRGVYKRKFGDAAGWAVQTGKLLKAHGFNSLGCWSDWRPFRATEQRMPYFPRWNFMSTYKNRREATCGPRGYPNQCMPVFDEAFEAFCDAHAKQLAATKDDPWLVGHFSDNELPFRPDLLEYYLQLPQADSGYQAAAKWWARRSGGDPARKMTRRDKDAFLEVVARRYYTTVAAAIRKYDPNHLYVGSRIHGRTIRPPMFKASTVLDVVSVNYYHRWSPEQQRISEWVKLSGRPFLASEWYAQSLESPDTEASGAGFRVRTDRDRGLFYQNYTLGLLRNGGCVGWHWFKYTGDGDGFHKGAVSNRFEPHEAMLKLMKQLNTRVYPLTTHFGKEAM